MAKISSLTAVIQSRDLQNVILAPTCWERKLIEYRPLGSSGNCIVTIAIGEVYLKDWETFAKPSWIRYCVKHDLGLFVVTETLVSESDEKWKKPTWQKLLLGASFKKNRIDAKNCCYLDTDILISPIAPNIFNSWAGHEYGLVSKIKNLPMPLDLVLRQFVYLRNHFKDSSYPLDSAVFMPIKKQYEYSGLAPFDDGACAGLVLFNIENCAEEMEQWFYKYDVDTASITGGDQIHLTWEIMSTGKVKWLPYEFQALWVYEMAWKYYFLYNGASVGDELADRCIRSSLFSNFFLHFAGSWHESDFWKSANIFDEDYISLSLSFENYTKIPVHGQSLGKVVPKLASRIDAT